MGARIDEEGYEPDHIWQKASHNKIETKGSTRTQRGAEVEEAGWL
jgi:hypothetical protein